MKELQNPSIICSSELHEITAAAKYSLLFTFLLDGEDDLILEDKGLDCTQHPPENDKDCQILNPSKLEQLPESRIVSDCQNGVLEFQLQSEVLHIARFPHDQWVFQGGGHYNIMKYTFDSTIKLI